LGQNRAGGGVAGPGVSENGVEGGYAVPNLVGRWGVKVEPSPAAEGGYSASPLESEHGGVERCRVADDDGGDGLAKVLCDVAGDGCVVADEGNVDDWGVAGDGEPAAREFADWHVGPLNDQVEVWVPESRNSVTSELQKRRATIHPGSPPSRPPQAAEAAVQAIKLGGKLSVTATEGECDESVDLANELGPEVSGNAGCPLTLTGPAPAIMAFGACNAETLWIGTAAEHPGIAAAVSEAIKASSRGSSSAKSQVNQVTIVPPS